MSYVISPQNPAVPEVVSTRWTATDIIAWITFIILIIFILIVIFFFFFNRTTVSQTQEFFGANYEYNPSPPDVTKSVSTTGNTIFIIPSGTPSGTSVTIAQNNLGEPGRTFLIKNYSPNTVTLTPASGVTLVHVDGTTGPDTLAADSLAMYITDYTSPNTTFRRIL